ncbi:MAG: hypothetical protein PHP85_12315 [Gallionella sp.]|nr:hypothetical protein [Gallionella sp.]
MIDQLSEDLLQTFNQVQLIDKYDVYQHLMSYWSDIMQDDAYLIAADGWLAGNDAGNGLMPPSLIIARYFNAEREAIEQLEAERYAEPLPQLASDVAALSARVKAHMR